MNIFITIIHVAVCLILITIVLIQRGRGGGGLVEGLSSVESMFGTRTNTFLTRTTTVCSVLFFITCLSLALLSVRQSKSLMRNRPQAVPAAATETPAAAPATAAATTTPASAPAAAAAATATAQDTAKKP